MMTSEVLVCICFQGGDQGQPIAGSFAIGQGPDANPEGSERDLTNDEIRALARNCAPKWRTVARWLTDASENGDLAFDESFVKTIADRKMSEEESMIVVLQKWVNLSSLHNWGELYKTFNDIDLGGVAKDVFAGHGRM